MIRLVAGAVLLGLLSSAYGRTCDPDEGTEPLPCDPNVCFPPDCACETTEPKVTLADRPQIVYLTFDDAIRQLDYDLYMSQIFGGNYTNPNGCPIRGTFYVCARGNDYSLAHKYYSEGHEIAAHSITHRNNQEYWKNLNQSEWEAEMGGMRQMLSTYANISEEAIRGTRAPFLQGGGDRQFNMMEEVGYTYDCGMPSQTNGFLALDEGRWPYSLDYSVVELQQACQVEECPTCSHPGIWTQPMLDLEDNLIGPDGHGYPCAMLDSCLGNENEDDVYNMLTKNFYKAYNGNTRAPIGFYTHAAWFFGYDYRFEAYKRVLEEITQLPDVWIVPVWAGLSYRMNPVTNAELVNGTLPEFNCDANPVYACTPNSCAYEDVNYPEDDMVHTEEYIKVCGSCPANFPWIHNPMGN